MDGLGSEYNSNTNARAHGDRKDATNAPSSIAFCRCAFLHPSRSYDAYYSVSMEAIQNMLGQDYGQAEPLVKYVINIIDLVISHANMNPFMI